ncbi:5208_t:CDS:2 [Dentiscutata erythropus]|uniref:5208_t:CDS:1 n=1 Tax=Dentiscutata erythropus TaxID=1348616 RepID=A0A9N9A825_9GLOM|nr:5208_t:CDS:2 [Dentiscutata erythropus]
MWPDADFVTWAATNLQSSLFSTEIPWRFRENLCRPPKVSRIDRLIPDPRTKLLSN